MNPAPNGDEPATKRDIERVVELIVQLHQQVDRRFEAIERRMDRHGDALTSIQGQMAAVTRCS
jgi:hypothetical protein